MDINAAIAKIANEQLSHHDLYGIACDALRQDNLTPGLREFFNEVRNSTKHMVILGCGVPLDYDLMAADAKALLSANAKPVELSAAHSPS